MVTGAVLTMTASCGEEVPTTVSEATTASNSPTSSPGQAETPNPSDTTGSPTFSGRALPDPGRRQTWKVTDERATFQPDRMPACLDSMDAYAPWTGREFSVVFDDGEIDPYASAYSEFHVEFPSEARAGEAFEEIRAGLRSCPARVGSQPEQRRDFSALEPTLLLMTHAESSTGVDSLLMAAGVVRVDGATVTVGAFLSRERLDITAAQMQALARSVSAG